MDFIDRMKVLEKHVSKSQNSLQTIGCFGYLMNKNHRKPLHKLHFSKVQLLSTSTYYEVTKIPINIGFLKVMFSNSMRTLIKKLPMFFKAL